MKYTKDNNPKIKTAMEQRTAEEILKSKLPHQFQHGWFGSNPTIEWEKAIEAMEEYATQSKEVCNGSDKGFSVDQVKETLRMGVNIGMQNVEKPRHEGDYNFNQEKAISECEAYLQSLTPSQPEVGRELDKDFDTWLNKENWEWSRAGHGGFMWYKRVNGALQGLGKLTSELFQLFQSSTKTK